MRVSAIIALVRILSGVKINRIEDKDAKAALLRDYLILRRAARDAEGDRDEIIRKFQEDWKDELPAVEKFRRENRPVLGHLDYLEAEKDANKAISDLFAREVELDLAPVPFDAVAGVSDDLSLEDAAFLEENGLLGV